MPSVSLIEPTTLNPYLYFKADAGITTSGGAVSEWQQVSHSEGNQIATYLVQGTANEQPQHDSSDNHVTYDSSDDHLDFYFATITQAGTLVSATSNGIWAFNVNTNSQADVNALGYFVGKDFAIDQYALILFPTLTDADLAGVVRWLEQNTNATKTASGSLSDYNRGRSDIVALRPEGLDVSSATNFYRAWRDCTSLTSFPTLDTSSGTNFYEAWYNCTGLTSFPALDASSGTDFRYAWRDCDNLTSFPLVDVSSGTNFYATWQDCSSLTSFASLDVSSGTNFGNTWRSCSSLTSFPSLDVSSGTSFNGSWQVCTRLTSFPTLDVSSGTNFSHAWYNCTGLTSFPSLNASSGTYFVAAWRNCSSLTSFPSGFFDSWNPSSISSGVFHNAWDGCSDLTATSVENILTSLATSGKHGTDDGTSGGSALADAVIDIDYDTGTGSLTTATNTAITTLKSRSWGVTINGVTQ